MLLPTTTHETTVLPVRDVTVAVDDGLLWLQRPSSPSRTQSQGGELDRRIETLRVRVDELIAPTKPRLQAWSEGG